MTQLSMSGEDWLSDRQRKAAKRLESQRAKTACKVADRLEAAAEALNELMSICNEIGDESRVKNAADSRLRLIEDAMEYANYLRAVYQERT